MEKILSKAARCDCRFQVLIGGSDDADIHFKLAMTAQPVKRISVQHAQQFDLSVKLQFSDFIKEQSAAVGEFKESRLGDIGARECALLVAEQFALDQVFGECGTVDVDPGSSATLRRLMNGACNQLLARSRFPSDEHRLGVASNPIGHAHESMHQRTGQNESRAVNLTADSVR